MAETKVRPVAPVTTAENRAYYWLISNYDYVYNDEVVLKELKAENECVAETVADVDADAVVAVAVAAYSQND